MKIILCRTEIMLHHNVINDAPLFNAPFIIFVARNKPLLLRVKVNTRKGAEDEYLILTKTA